MNPLFDLIKLIISFFLSFFGGSGTEITLDTELPTGATESNPVRLFIQGGQSNCGGAASIKQLRADDSDTYPELVDAIDGAYLASKFTPVKDFRIRPMKAGEAKDGDQFGPEVSISQRLVEASGFSTNVMIVKYCRGGSNLKYEWNPESSANNWDRDEDDGTAEWLTTNGYAVLNANEPNYKNHLYATLVYYVRKTTEALDEASIPYEFSGFFWLQGFADNALSTWEEYSADTIRLHDTLRSDINEPYLPILDFGAMPHHKIQTGKVHAASTIENGNVSVVDWSMASTNPESCCVAGAGNVCLDSSWQNYDLFEYYGYDPAWPDDSKPEGATDKEFRWFKDFPDDQHFEYDGMVLRGRVVANAYMREFSPDWAELTPEMEEHDAQILFPVLKCAEGEIPSADNLCFMDLSLDTTPVVEPDCR